MASSSSHSKLVSGGFVTLAGERYYAIDNVDMMAPFFVSVVSDGDHWLFVASNGGLTAGRVSPETALLPYVTVDKIYDSTAHTGSKTLLRVESAGQQLHWEPFNQEHDDRYSVSRKLYKNVLGNKLLFEEINHDLQLAFRYSWATSDAYGFVRHCELENLGPADCQLELLDGLLNILPAGTLRLSQTNSSYLVDAYKWNELDEQTGLAFFTLFSRISDRAEPSESLKATTVFCLGLEQARILLSSEQLDCFRRGEPLTPELHKRGIRGAYLVNSPLHLASGATQHWQLLADVEQSQSDSVQLLQALSDPAAVAESVSQSVTQGSDALARILAAGDGFQLTAEENVSVHHYANVLFNILRGGIFDRQYTLASSHFGKHLRLFNRGVFERHRQLLDALPEQLDCNELRSSLEQQGDPQLLRLGYEYLPITFGRRHGDPSRPWNHFAIKLSDEQGERLLSYQGNWRDIFQNWETLLFSFPEFIENVIAKFVNASTAEGYNPYRISDEGIDWEVEEPDDPWSNIGYWGDHQVIYLLKLLELSRSFHPARLGELLHQPIYSYANVPYRIKSFAALLADAKSTVEYDQDKAQRIEQRVAELGADGKLLLDANGQVYQVTLLEKLLVPLLGKLGNLVIDGGIWLNTQRPEWNDANNALVGHGLSMVTLYYMRRYISFLQLALQDQPAAASLSEEVKQWLLETAESLGQLHNQLDDKPVSADTRYQLLLQLGEAASRYRQTVYEQECFSGLVSQDLTLVSTMLDDALAVIDHSIRSNLREDGLYHAYNLLDLQPQAAGVERLYPMLEGQVAVLSSGAIEPVQAVSLLDTLFDSALYRPDQDSFMLYPDRQLPGFLQKNCVAAEQVAAIPLLERMLAGSDRRIVECDAGGTHRFNAELTNVADLNARLDELAPVYGDELQAAREPLQTLYEYVFQHRAFTGRSGGMFGFEGLGSIYWHMVSKLLLAVQENFFRAREQGADAATCQRLGEYYYRVRRGLSFNKSPLEYGAFPADPYSHTPLHAGAQQPGMTGQVKEEILSRFGELGIRVSGGSVSFDPGLLRACEFLSEPQPFRYLDVDDQWQTLEIPAQGLAFTWCQLPIVYQLNDSGESGLSIDWQEGETQLLPELELNAAVATELFQRTGRIQKIELRLASKLLLEE
ncbi:MAG: hypothetical protein ABJ308_11265 [Halieaceae bacterium]